MPELPDVEMAGRLLEGLMKGAKITLARSSDRRILRPQAPAAFSRTLVGRIVNDVERRGKWLRVSLDDGSRFFSHLGMTGEWVAAEVDEPPHRFERARIDFTRRRQRWSLRYLDARRFGRLLGSPDDIASWRELGPDPMADGLDPETLALSLGRSRRPVKEALMDQTVLAGIGNILATEGLWHARLDPRCGGDQLTTREVGDVVRGLRKAIQRQLESREKVSDGEPEDVFFAYGREGERCRRCGWTLRRIVLGGRGTTFCDHCQRRPGSSAK